MRTTNEYSRTTIETLVHDPEVETAMLFRKLFPEKAYHGAKKGTNSFVVTSVNSINCFTN